MRLPTIALLLLLLLAALAAAPLVRAQDGATSGGEGESFASVFFFSHQTDALGERHLEPVGTGMTWLLILMSIVNMGLIGRHALLNQRKSIVPEGVVVEVRRLLAAGDFRQVLDMTAKEGSYFSRLLHESLSEAGHGVNAMIRTMENTADLLTTTRLRPVELLYMFGQISPMMGLLGTVYGIIHAFLAFVSSGGNASPVLLAGGIGTALVATFWGLIVAIPALAGYAILRNRINELTLEAINEVEEILNQMRPRSAPQPIIRPTPMPAPASPATGSPARA